MSVIPFVISGSRATIVESREAYENAGGLDGNVILIKSFDSPQVQDTTSSNASYDLRVGDEYRDHRDSTKNDLIDGQKICLQPGSAVIIETTESVQFPKTRFGHIVPKVSLLQEGLSNTSSKIDPGYEGKLLITVFNLGKRTLFLEKGQKFCTMYVLDIGEGVTPYQKGAQRIIGGPRSNIFRSFRDFIEANQTFLIALSILLSCMIALVQLVSSFADKDSSGVPINYRIVMAMTEEFGLPKL